MSCRNRKAGPCLHRGRSSRRQESRPPCGSARPRRRSQSGGSYRPEPAMRAGASNRGHGAAGRPETRRSGSPGLRRCWAAAFAAPFGRKPYGATSYRARLPRHRPQPVPAVTPRCRGTRAGPGRDARVECADRRAKGHSRRSGTPRKIQVDPSSVKGLTAKGQARGQARNARGEPYEADKAPESRVRFRWYVDISACRK
jgi:hypothetical protein